MKRVRFLISLCLFCLCFSSWALAQEKKVIFSVGIHDPAFPNSDYDSTQKFFEEYLPEHRYVFVSLSHEDLKANLRNVQKAVGKLKDNEVIDTLLINTHGDHSRFLGLGSFSKKGPDQEFNQFIATLMPKVSENTRLIFNSCLAICGGPKQAEESSQALRDAFYGKLDFIYASYTLETSGRASYYFDEKTVTSDSLKTIKELSFERKLLGARLALVSVGLFGTPVFAASFDLNLILEPLVFIATTGYFGTFGYLGLKKFFSTHRLLNYTKKHGVNIGRSFEFTENGVEISEVDRNTRSGWYNSHGLNECTELFEE